MYDPESAGSAHIDLALESLAERYIGTKFRRLHIVSSSQLCERYGVSKELGLVCFRDAELVSSMGAQLLEDGEDIRKNDLVRTK